ncbi:MAG: AraC family transcriptional regulator [Marinifilaceae bacterium]
MKNKNATYNLMDTFYYCQFYDEEKFERHVSNHMLAYIYSGEMVLIDNGKQEILRKGEAVFIRRNHTMQKIKRPSSTEPFRALFIVFTTPLLKQFLKDNKQISYLSAEQTDNKKFIYLEKHPFIENFFTSLDSYFNTKLSPTYELLNIKLQEALLVLMELDKSLFTYLFDFKEEWKIDLYKFMEVNYKADLSLNEFANFTGRSLSAFKRDFEKIYSTSPHKWIMNKRLEEAHTSLLSKHMQVSELAYELGFKNLSHFSNAFKTKYGLSPTALIK